jgi:hypothetical protein
MIPIEENAVLSTDLDCQWNTLRRVLHFYPVPGNLVRITDPRLSDPRMMLDGSVIDESVSPHAAIVQSKLNLNGVIPPAWFTPSPDIDDPDAPSPPRYAARGDLAELLVRKGAPNGYAPVDDNLRLLPANVTPGAGLGTVSEVQMRFPEQFSDLAPSSGTTVSYNLSWKPVPNNSWFGAYGDIVSDTGPWIGHLNQPQFHVELLPDEFIPELTTAKFTTGLCEPDVLPVAKFGEDHAPGMVPDPGDTGEGDPDEYLARNMTYMHFDAHHFYQPRVTTPSITLISIQDTTATVTIRTTVPGALQFYRAGRPSFLECANEFTIHVALGTLVEAYAAKEGYNNSVIASYRVPQADSILDFTEA